MTEAYNWLKKYQLNFAAFVNGAVILVVELVAVRLLSPYFGSSFFVWTSIIGVILLSLSIGYWQGGKLADKSPNSRVLSMILLAAASLVLLAALTQHMVLRWSASLGNDVRLLSLLAALLLFAPANIFLGMVSPFIARLELHRVNQTGETVGNIFAAGTLGSLVGVFATGYILFGLVGSTRLLVAMALLCVLNTFLVDLKSLLFWRAALLMVALSLALRPPSIELAGSETLADIDTSYSRYLVSRTGYKGSKARILQTDLHSAQSGIDLAKPTELIFAYTRAFDIYKLWLQPKRTALIGGGANVYASHFAADNPDAHIDVAEIDPALLPIAKTYFGYEPRDNISIHDKDGRVFLQNASAGSYDVVFVDAFNNTSIPFHLATRQMVEQIYRSLSPNGMAVVNVISHNNPDKQQFLKAIAATYGSVFAEVEIYRVSAELYSDGKANYLLVAKKQPAPVAAEPTTYLKDLLERKIKLDLSGVIVLTDELAPVEQLQAQP